MSHYNQLCPGQPKLHQLYPGPVLLRGIVHSVMPTGNKRSDNSKVLYVIFWLGCHQENMFLEIQLFPCFSLKLKMALNFMCLINPSISNGMECFTYYHYFFSSTRICSCCLFIIFLVLVEKENKIKEDNCQVHPPPPKPKKKKLPLLGISN